MFNYNFVVKGTGTRKAAQLALHTHEDLRCLFQQPTSRSKSTAFLRKKDVSKAECNTAGAEGEESDDSLKRKTGVKWPGQLILSFACRKCLSSPSHIPSQK